MWTRSLLTTCSLAAALLAVSALPQHDGELDRSHERAADNNFDGESKPRNLDSLGGGNLVRGVRDARRFDFIPYLNGRRYEIGPFVHQMQHRTINFRDLADVPKRNFDEIDRTGFDNYFGKRSDPAKRNFDEIDRTGFDRFMKRALYDDDMFLH